MGKKLVFERGGGPMQPAMNVGERAGTSAEAAAPLVAFGNAHAFLLVFHFQVKSLQVSAHPRQFLTSHTASISHSSQSKNGLRT